MMHVHCNVRPSTQRQWYFPYQCGAYNNLTPKHLEFLMCTLHKKTTAKKEINSYRNKYTYYVPKANTRLPSSVVRGTLSVSVEGGYVWKVGEGFLFIFLLHFWLWVTVVADTVCFSVCSYLSHEKLTSLVSIRFC